MSASGAPPISYRNKTLYVFIIILSFQVLFPRLLRKCGIKGHVMFARRFIRHATKFCQAWPASASPGFSSFFFFFFFLCVRGVLSFHLLGPQPFLVRAGFFFLQAVLFLLSSSQQACPVIVLFHGNGAAGGGGFPLVVWRCKRRRKEGLICLGTGKKNKKK